MLFTFQYQWGEEDSWDEEGGLEKSQRQNKRLCQKICQICHRPIQKEEGVFVCVWKESHLPWVFWKCGDFVFFCFFVCRVLGLEPMFCWWTDPLSLDIRREVPTHTERKGENRTLASLLTVENIQTNFAAWKIKGGGGGMSASSSQAKYTSSRSKNRRQKNKTLSRIN